MTLPGQAVIDASVAVKWVVGEEGSDLAALLLDARLFAPDLLCAECSNILWKKVRRGELTSDEAEAACRILEGAEIELLPMRPYLLAATRIAIELDHPAYDSMYLALAEDFDVVLVTADEGLVRKIRQVAPARFERRFIALSELTA
jgi:predicted nucleic acid-binding protein